MNVPFEIPSGLSLETNVSVADWVNERLLPFGASGDGVLVGEIVPRGFEAYARILHPARRRVGDRYEPIRWADLARERGKRIHPEVKLKALLGEEFRDAPHWGELSAEGSIPDELAIPLIEVLERHTAAPGRCLFCIWDGFGVWQGGGDYVLAKPGWRGRVQRRAMRREARRRARRSQAELSLIPRVRIHLSPDGRGALREYFLFRGALGAATAFRDVAGRHFPSPNIWWPEDRSWVVVSEIDAPCTYVGGPVQLVRAVIGEARLEVVSSDLSHRFDWLGDRINRPDLP